MERSYLDYSVNEDGTVIKSKFGTVLKQSLHKFGYRRVTLVSGKDRIRQNVHVIVCEAWHGPKPSPELEVRHLDGDKLNNHYTNLSWGTHQENMDDMVKHGTASELKKTHCPKGHEYSGQNLMLSHVKGRASPQRVCKACKKDYNRKYREKK